MAQPSAKRKRELLTMVVVFLIVLGVSALVVYLVASKAMQNRATQTEQAAAVESASEPRAAPTPTRPESTILDRVFSLPTGETPAVPGQTWGETAATITVRLMLSALLGGALAFRPRKRLPLLKRNPYVSQTQILLAVVAAALMIIVGDNAARAFGIFAAVSVVRFRTNIRDPKEITVLLISLAIGLGAGVGRWDLSLILTLFALVLLYLLEYREATEVSRSMDLKIVSRNVHVTQEVLKEVLKRRSFDAELRAIGRESLDQPGGSMVYSVDVSPTVSLDELSEDILALDAANVSAIEWDQKKSQSYLYQ